MAKLLKLRRGTTTQHGSFTGAEGEVTIDTTKDTAVVHDGSTAGGRPLAREDMNNVPAGTILGTQLENSGVTAGQYGSSSAIPIVTVDAQGLVTAASTTAIDSTTIANGTSNVAVANNGNITATRSGTTRFKVDNNGVDVTGTLNLSDNLDMPDNAKIIVGNGDDLKIFHDGNNSVIREDGTGDLYLQNGTSNILRIQSTGTQITGNLDVSNGIDVTGNITATGEATISGQQLTVQGTSPRMRLVDTDQDSDFQVSVDSGSFKVEDTTNSGADRFVIDSNGTVSVNGNLDVGAGIDVTGAIIGDRASFKDDGTAGPTVQIMTDDNNPWALAIGNDSYSTQEHKGLMFYQNNDGTMYQQFRGIGSFESVYFSTSNNTTTENFMHLDAARALHLYHQNSPKLSTSSTGVSVTGTVAATSYTGDGSNLTGIQPFPSGTKMLFQQTSAPTGWTKVTSNVENKALRVTSGTVGSGGSNAFTNTLASRGITANAGNTTAAGNVSVANAASSGNISVSSVSTSGTVNSHTLSTNEMPSHSHGLTMKISQHNCRGNACGGGFQGGSSNYSWGTQNTNNAGGSGGHSHGFSGSSHNHNATFSGSNHSHNASFSGNAHNHSISVGNLDMAVQYIDVIVATKD